MNNNVAAQVFSNVLLTMFGYKVLLQRRSVVNEHIVPSKYDSLMK
nr:hypothetical protein [uncultured Psychrobacter sp.]